MRRPVSSGMRYAPKVRRAQGTKKRRPAMKKISTVQRVRNEIFKEQKLTIGVDLGDRWSFYCVLDEAGKIILEQKVPTTPEAMKQLHRFRNGFGIQVIALVGLHVGLHVLSRHQSHFMTLFAQRPPQKVRSTTGLHADQLHLQIRGEGQQLPARTSLADHNPASRIQSNQMKDRLTQINA